MIIVMALARILIVIGCIHFTFTGTQNSLGMKPLTVTPSKNSSPNDFDFLVGKWKINNRKLKSRLSNCTEWEEFEATGEMTKILKGIGNTDNFLTTFEGIPFEGRTLRLFNPKSKLWSIYWADSTTGALEVPVTGSFDGNIGKFYTKDIFNGREIVIMFQWDKTNPHQPIWSQAFSMDNGCTWEWNWHMNFCRTAELNSNQIIKVIELRNYLLKPDVLTRFQNYFQDHFIDSQQILNGFILGRFQIKDINNRFFWIRGFNDMASRLDFLKSFYDKSPVWKKYGPEANDMMLDSDHVHLLRPLNLTGDWQSPSHGILRSHFLSGGDQLLIDFWVAKTGKIGELIDRFRNQHHAPHVTLWIAEQGKNEFRHPAMQDSNVLVSISSFQNQEKRCQYVSDYELAKETTKLIAERVTLTLNHLT